MRRRGRLLVLGLLKYQTTTVARLYETLMQAMKQRISFLKQAIEGRVDASLGRKAKVKRSAWDEATLARNTALVEVEEALSKLQEKAQEIKAKANTMDVEKAWEATEEEAEKFHIMTKDFCTRMCADGVIERKNLAWLREGNSHLRHRSAGRPALGPLAATGGRTMEALNQAVNPSVSEEEQAQLQRASEQFAVTLREKADHYRGLAKVHCVKNPKQLVFTQEEILATEDVLVQEAGNVLWKQFRGVFGLDWKVWLWRFFAGKERVQVAEEEHAMLSLAFKDVAGKKNGMSAELLLGMLQGVMEKYQKSNYWMGDNFFKELGKVVTRYEDILKYAVKACEERRAMAQMKVEMDRLKADLEAQKKSNQEKDLKILEQDAKIKKQSTKIEQQDARILAQGEKIDFLQQQLNDVMTLVRQGQLLLQVSVPNMMRILVTPR